eukprot:scaffold59964_cov22-Tisochrysis_lutea.AAC.1
MCGCKLSTGCRHVCACARTAQVLPHRPSMVLLGVPGPEDMFPQQTPSQDASTSAQAQVVLVEGSAAAGSTN